MKKFIYFMSFILVISVATLLLFNFTSCSTDDDSLICDAQRYATQQWNRGISVKNDAHGIYLAFQNDSVFDAFLEKIDHVVKAKREDLMQDFYSEGFISRKSWENMNNVSENEQHPSFTFSLLLNPEGLIQIGDILYQDDHELRLYEVTEHGKKLIKGTIEKALPRKDKTVTKESEGYPGGRSYMNTMKLSASLTYDTRVIRDDIVEVEAYLLMRQVDHDAWKNANATFYASYTCDAHGDNYRFESGTTPKTNGKDSDFSYILAKDWDLVVNSFSVTVFANRKDGTGLNVTLKLE
ncbi:MAG: hypothetical protein K6E76_02810 [Patescibacteria group bacterium]|nr:hypothetical protein [Patescibacteria group bacterium]